jgi:hypothetical protein
MQVEKSAGAEFSPTPGRFQKVVKDLDRGSGRIARCAQARKAPRRRQGAAHVASSIEGGASTRRNSAGALCAARAVRWRIEERCISARVQTWVQAHGGIKHAIDPLSVSGIETPIC